MHNNFAYDVIPCPYSWFGFMTCPSPIKSRIRLCLKLLCHNCVGTASEWKSAARPFHIIHFVYVQNMMEWPPNIVKFVPARRKHETHPPLFLSWTENLNGAQRKYIKSEWKWFNNCGGRFVWIRPPLVCLIAHSAPATEQDAIKARAAITIKSILCVFALFGRLQCGAERNHPAITKCRSQMCTHSSPWGIFWLGVAIEALTTETNVIAFFLAFNRSRWWS